MSLKNNKRSFINNFVWYCSGLNVRELSSLYQSRSNYFGIGGLNIFSTFLLFLLGMLGLHIAFPLLSMVPCIFFGVVLSFLVFVFNRQTINALSMSDKILVNQKHSLTLLPIFFFALFIGFLISIPFQFYLFNITYNPSIFKMVRDLNALSDYDITSKIASWTFTVFIALLILLPTLIQHYTIKSKLKNNNSTLLNELMWFCSGANKEIIRTCPNDYSKYFGIGGTILFTALMACLSGGYAFYTAFDSSTLAIYFGLFWGAMIFNLDRFIVNTMYSDGKPGISWLEIFSGLPRIIIAFFLGLVISYPLEMKIFEDSINERLELMKVEAVIKHHTKLDSAYVDINSNQDKINSNENLKSKYQKEIDIAFKEWEAIEKVQYAKTCSRTDIGGRTTPYPCPYWDYPPEKKVKWDRYQDIKTRNDLEISSLRVKIADDDRKIKDDEKEKKGYENQHNKTTIALDKLSARMKAFEAIKDDPEEKATATASMVIMILLIIIEISPVLLKMMLSTSDYDVILDADRNEIKTRELVRMSRDNDWANTEILKITEENKKKITDKQNELNNELNSNLELLGTIAKAQSEIAQIAIEKWKQDEIKKASLNPMNIIQSNAMASNLSFEDKFWLYNDTTEEYTYIFKSGITNELWLKNKDIVNIGKWFKVNSNQLEIELNSDKKIYDIEELTDATFLLCESGTTNKLQLTAV